MCVVSVDVIVKQHWILKWLGDTIDSLVTSVRRAAMTLVKQSSLLVLQWICKGCFLLFLFFVLFFEGEME